LLAWPKARGRFGWLGHGDAAVVWWGPKTLRRHRS
jgi:hypothetical protein